MLLALYHDAPEILTGDLPTPVKYDNPAIREAYRQVEEVAADRLLSLLPEELRPDYGGCSRTTARRRRSAVWSRRRDKLSALIMRGGTPAGQPGSSPRPACPRNGQSGLRACLPPTAFDEFPAGV